MSYIKTTCKCGQSLEVPSDLKQFECPTCKEMMRIKPRKPAPKRKAPTAPMAVRVTDIEMPFFSMIIFMVKWVIAAIPAGIILALIIPTLMVLATAIMLAWAS